MRSGGRPRSSTTEFVCRLSPGMIQAVTNCQVGLKYVLVHLSALDEFLHAAPPQCHYGTYRSACRTKSNLFAGTYTYPTAGFILPGHPTAMMLYVIFPSFFCSLTKTDV